MHEITDRTSLPAFRFAISEEDDSLKDQMNDLFSKAEHANVAKCIERYGSDAAEIIGGDGDPLGRGIDRLCGHFDGTLDFFGNRYVFAVILDRVSYGKTADPSRQALDAIRDLRSVIPRTYLHVPAGFDFRIGSSSMNREKAVFHYWPQRLVELSSFRVDVNENVPWHLSMNYAVTSYKLRVFVGFDRVRIHSEEETKAASLYVYSRHSGRLIKHEQDARHILGLNAGGSTYSSGLTVIVDDIDGKLPLNPTKQDVAFAEQANGDVHKGNLFAWVGAVASFFYNYHLAKFDNKKMVLTEKIRCYGPDPTLARMKDIDRSELTTFMYHHKNYGSKSIRFVQASAKEIVGIDTHFKLVCDKHPVNVVSSSVTTDERASKKRKVDQLQCGGGGHAEYLTMTYGASNAGLGAGAHNKQRTAGIAAPQFTGGNPGYSHNPHHINSPYFNNNIIGNNLNKQYQEQLARQQQQQQSAIVNSLPHTITRELPCHSDLAGGSRDYHNENGAPHLVNGSHMQRFRPIRRKTIAHLGRLQQEQPGNEDDPPLMGGSITADEPSPITKGSKRRNGDLAADEADVATNTTLGTQALAVTSSNANGDVAVSRKEGDDGANNAMADAPSDDGDDDSVSSTKSYYKDLCEKLTVVLEQRKVADRAARIETKRLKRDVAELTKEVKRQQNMVSKLVNKVLPTSGSEIDEGHI